MIKIGLFIIPNLSLKNFISKLKSLVRKKFGHQTYINHLPHCSLYVFKTNKKNLNILKDKRLIISKYKKKYLTDKTDIFYNDPITTKNTYIIKIKKNIFLSNLQNLILREFKKYALKKNSIYKKKLMNKNFKTFGYPFIRSNWKPHFTIASISPKNNQSDFIKEFKKIKIKKKQHLNKVYLYQIKKNNHKFLCKIDIR